MYQDYIEIIGKPCKFKPTAELKWINGELKQLWVAETYGFLGMEGRYYREQWRNVPKE